MQIKITVQHLNEIKQFANQEYLANSIPKELEGPEFLVLCYAKAVDRFLNKQGLAINLVYQQKLPYEVVDE